MALLGSMLLEEDAIGQVIETVHENSFYKDAHKKIFSAVTRLYQQGHSVDLVTLTDFLKKEGVLEEVGNASYLASLASFVPTAANVEHYARIVREKSILRSLIQTATQIAKMTGHKIRIEKGLKEISYGKWEGLTVEQVRKRWPEDHIRFLADPGWNAPTAGETANQIAARAMPVVDKIKTRHKDGNVLVISHKATIRIILCSFLGVDVGRFRYRLGAPVASVSVVEFGHHGPLIKVLGDTAHLPEDLRKLQGT